MTAARITNNGRKLAISLNPSIGITNDILETCSLICRHAKTFHALMEFECNHGTTPWVEKREPQLVARICQLVEQLPLVNGEAIGAVFSGDPRGATVKLRMPDGRYDDWGQEGICVPIGR